MEPFFADYWECLNKLHQEIRRAIDGLSSAALDWIPGPGMNSIAVLVVHLTGAERYWIGDVVAQEHSDRDRSAEFTVQNMEVAALEDRLTGTMAYARGVLGRLTLQDLATSRISSRDSRQFTVGWALVHALEHTALHTGQIQITRSLLDVGA